MKKSQKKKLSLKKSKIHQWNGLASQLKGGTSANSLPTIDGLKVYMSVDLPENQCL